MTVERVFRTLRIARFLCGVACLKAIFVRGTRGIDGKESRKEEGARSFLPTAARFSEQVCGRRSGAAFETMEASVISAILKRL